MSGILVLGGTGMLGEPVVRHLLEDGFEVSVLARNSIKIRELFGQSVDLVVFQNSTEGQAARLDFGCRARCLEEAAPCG